MPRQPKAVQYADEQLLLKSQIVDVIGFDQNMSFTLSEIDTNTNKQNAIMQMLPELKKYFSLTKFTNIHTPNNAVRPWLSIIKNVLKDDYEIFNKPVVVDRIHTSRYFFRKKTT